jgi:hypothetical protein
MGDGGAAAPRRKGPGRARHLSRPKRDDTDDPRRSRERALKVLFQADLRGIDPSIVLREVAEDDDARAMLDELDELGAAEVREPREVSASGRAGGCDARRCDPHRRDRGAAHLA